MLKKWMFVVALLALGCGDESDSGTGTKTSDAGSSKVKDASTRDARGGSTDEEGSEDASMPTDEGSSVRDAGPQSMDPAETGKPESIDDAGSIEVATPDGGTVVITPGQDGGAELSGMGSCCSEHATAGCNNADLMVCVCEKDPSCCTKAWGPGCALIVNSRFCQEGVRECVCDPNGKVAQARCCDDGWSKTCDVYAQGQCEAVPGCF